MQRALLGSADSAQQRYTRSCALIAGKQSTAQESRAEQRNTSVLEASIFEHDLPWGDAKFAAATVGVEGHSASEPHRLETRPIAAEHRGEKKKPVSCILAGSLSTSKVLRCRCNPENVEQQKQQQFFSYATGFPSARGLATTWCPRLRPQPGVSWGWSTRAVLFLYPGYWCLL